jgi:hypothetical protein
MTMARLGLKEGNLGTSDQVGVATSDGNRLLAPRIRKATYRCPSFCGLCAA